MKTVTSALRFIPIVLLVVGFGFVLGVAGAQDAAGLDRERYQRGLEIYLDNFCGGCHLLSAAGTSGFFGPAHDAAGVIAAARVQDPNYRGGAVDAAGYLLESLLDPGAYRVPGFALSRHRMPAYGHLSEEDLDALVYLLLQQPLTGE